VLASEAGQRRRFVVVPMWTRASTLTASLDQVQDGELGLLGLGVAGAQAVGQGRAKGQPVTPLGAVGARSSQTSATRNIG
jgi:hypothetical protein